MAPQILNVIRSPAVMVIVLETMVAGAPLRTFMAMVLFGQSEYSMTVTGAVEVGVGVTVGVDVAVGVLDAVGVAVQVGVLVAVGVAVGVMMPNRS